MGKGTIISGGGGGLYTVTLELSRARITETIARMTDNIAALNTRIAAIQTLMDAKEAEMSALASQIAVYEADKAKFQKEYCAAIGEMIKLISARDAYTRQKNMAVLQQKALVARIAYLNRATPADPSVAAWCADKTENLTGAVGIIEIPGERGAVLIQPGYNSNAAYLKARDGQLQPSIAGDPAAVFYNLAMLPGWQKWKPTYRVGVILTLDKTANTCSVRLDAAKSSAQSLNINQQTVLTNVPIEYMSCNAFAFSVNDRVVVKFVLQDYAAPKVIGFESNPKSCGAFIVLTTWCAGESVYSALVWDAEKNAVAKEEDIGFASPIATNDPKWIAWWAAAALDPSQKSLLGSGTFRSQFEYDLNPAYPATYKELPSQFPEITDGKDYCSVDWDTYEYTYHFESYGGFPVDPTTWDADIPPQVFVPSLIAEIPDSGETFFLRHQKESVMTSRTDATSVFSTPYGKLSEMTTWGWEDYNENEHEYYGLARKYYSAIQYGGSQKTLTSRQGEKAVCLICMLYYTLVTCHYHYSGGAYWDVTYTPDGNRQYHTHAAALFFKDGYQNTPVIPRGRNTDFEAACEAVMEKFYTVNGYGAAEIGQVYLTAQIVS